MSAPIRSAKGSDGRTRPLKIRLMNMPLTPRVRPISMKFSCGQRRERLPIEPGARRGASGLSTASGGRGGPAAGCDLGAVMDTHGQRNSIGLGKSIQISGFLEPPPRLFLLSSSYGRLYNVRLL